MDGEICRIYVVLVVVARRQVVPSLEFVAELVVDVCVLGGLWALGSSWEAAVFVELQGCPSVALSLSLLGLGCSDDVIVVVHGLGDALRHDFVQEETRLSLEIGQVGIQRDLGVVDKQAWLALHLGFGLFDIMSQYFDDDNARLQVQVVETDVHDGGEHEDLLG